MNRLLHFAGPRQGLPADAMARLEEEARLVWQDKVHSYAAQRRRRSFQLLAAAAAVLLGVGLALWFGPLGTGYVSDTATVEARSGRVTDDSGKTLAVGDALDVGRAIETGEDGRAALRLAGGASVRLDGDTRLDVRGAGALRLVRGAVYVDTDGKSSLEVETPYGVAHDVGTRFEVRLAGETVRVRVREGEVRFETDSDSHAATEGTVLTVHGDGTVERGEVESWDSAWSWILGARPPFEIQGRTVREVVDWYSGETGLAVRYDGPVARQAESVVSAGAVEGLTPEEILEAVLPAAGLSFRIEGGSLVVTPLASRD